MAITALYAAILAVLFIGLSIRTLSLRRVHKIAVGDGNNPALLRAMRAHANFSEYVPMTLLLIYMFEQVAGGSSLSLLIHGLCLCLLMGRMSHAYGISQVTENYRYRVFGMALTFTALGGAALGLLVNGLAQTLG